MPLTTLDREDSVPDSQRPTMPEIPTAPPPPEYAIITEPKIPKSRAVLEAAWLMLENLFGKEPEHT